MAVASILRRISSPLLQVGDLAFDCEVAVQRGARTQFTENRIGAGVLISDHSFNLAREYVVDGAVSAIPQLQNAGRPGFSGPQNLADLGTGVSDGLLGTDFSSRVGDFEQRLEAAMLARDELELVSKVVGRRRVVLTDFQASTTAEDGNAVTYRLTLREVLRAGLTIADAVQSALDLNGSGGATPAGSGGPSTTTAGVLDVVP